MLGGYYYPILNPTLLGNLLSWDGNPIGKPIGNPIGIPIHFFEGGGIPIDGY